MLSVFDWIKEKTLEQNENHMKGLAVCDFFFPSGILQWTADTGMANTHGFISLCISPATVDSD